MRLGTGLITALLTLSFVTVAQGQEAKEPANKEIKKEPGNKENPQDKKTDDKGKDDKKDDKGNDDKKDDKKNPKDVPPAPKFTYAATFSGKLINIKENGEMSIQVKYKVQVAHADANQRLFNWQKDLANREYGIAVE